jgi:hypothetical protein
MSMIESILVTLVVGGAALYLLCRAWLRFVRPGDGCCGRCPMAGSKIRLAAPPERVSSNSLT